jgi:hypothetical protein
MPRHPLRLSACVLAAMWLVISRGTDPIEARQRLLGTSQACPGQRPVPVILPDRPADTCFPADRLVATAFFDDFAWRTFIAMIWPAQSGARGVANPNAKLDDPGDRVFESYKAEWESFTSSPSDWDVYDPDTPCGPRRPGDPLLVLASNSKYANLRQGGFKPLAHLINALPSKYSTWAMYHTSFNRVTYEQIKNEKLHDRAVVEAKKKSKTIQFAVGGMTLKSAWIEIPDEGSEEQRKKNAAMRGRYYTRTATIFDPKLDKCRTADVSLVGLHIVAQTPQSSPYWIWTTFEHVDNVPPTAKNVPPATHEMAFNHGDGKPMPALKDEPNKFPKLNWAKPALYNVEREVDTIADTASTNHLYNNAVAGVWKNYRLVMTHWPVDFTSSFRDPQRMTPGPYSPSFAVANPVLETFAQGTTCMGCHNGAKLTNYIWAFETHVVAGVSPADAASIHKLTMTPALKELKKVLEAENKRPRKRQDD